MRGATARETPASRVARAAACALRLVVLLAAVPKAAPAVFILAAMGAICVTSRREEVAKQPSDAKQYEDAPSVPNAEPAAAESSASSDEDEEEDEPPPPPPPPPPRLSFRLVPPAALSAAAAEPFDFGGKQYSPRRDGRVAVAVAPDTPCEALLAFCAAWLRVRPESLSVQGPRLTLSPASPRRTAEQAGLGEASPPSTPPAQSDGAGAALAEHPVFALPFCCICLEAASGAVWACRAAQRHVCCGECARRYAATRIFMRPTAAALHCPVPGCPHTLLNSIQLQRLVNTEDVRAARAQRIADQAERLRRISAGQEVRRSPARCCCRALTQRVRELSWRRCCCGARRSRAPPAMR